MSRRDLANREQLRAIAHRAMLQRGLVLHGDGVRQPWQWVWVPAAAPPPPPPPRQ